MTFHKLLEGDDLHIARSQTGSVNPNGVVTAKIIGEEYWDSANNIFYIAEAADNSSWVAVTGAFDQFVELNDTPNSFSGQASKGVRVNSGETALEFYNIVDTDEKTKVSSNDSTPGYLNGKLVAGNNITLTENSDGGNETLTISFSGGSSAKYADYYSTVQTSIGITNTTITLNSTRQSDAAFTLSSNELTINTAGTYRIDYDVSLLIEGANRDVKFWFEKNGVEIPGTRGKAQVDSNTGASSAHAQAIVTFSQNDVLRIRGISDSNSAKSCENGARLTIQTIGANGAQGATGPTGPTGSGSNVIIKDEGINLSNTPHSSLNFVGSGVTATDGGGGVATITIPGSTSVFGSAFASAISDGISATTSSVYQQKLRLTTSNLTLGTYYINYSFEIDGVGSKAHCRVELNDTTELNYSVVDASIDGYIVVSGWKIMDSFSGINDVDIDFCSNSTSTVSIRRAKICIWRIN